MDVARAGRPHDFRFLLAAAAISQAGTQVSLIALPLVAVVVLHASTFQTGLLATAQNASFLLIGLPAGAWIDRLRRRPVLIIADAARALLLVTVPVAAAFGALTLPQLYTVAFAAGLGTVLFDVAHMSYVPSLVARRRLVAANSRLEAIEYGAFTSGPAIGGLLVQVLTAPFAIVTDALSYLASGLLISAIRARESPPSPAGRRGLWPEIWEGVAFVIRQPLLRPVMIAGSMLMLFETAWTSIQAVFLVRDLRLPAAMYGLLLAVGAAGGLAGALCASRVIQRFGASRVVRLMLATTTPVMLVMPLSEAGWRLALYPAGAFVSWFGSAVFNVAQLTIRQQVCPEEMRGRVNATMRFVMWGSMPLGGLIGGGLGQLLSVRPALWFCALGSTAATVPLLTMRFRNRTVVSTDMPAPTMAG
jgi:MFS family permease